MSIVVNHNIHLASDQISPIKPAQQQNNFSLTIYTQLIKLNIWTLWVGLADKDFLAQVREDRFQTAKGPTLIFCASLKLLKQMLCFFNATLASIEKEKHLSVYYNTV